MKEIGLIGNRVYLSFIKESDLEKILIWKNNKLLNDLIGNSYTPVSEFEIIDWYKKNQIDKNQVLFGIYDKDSKEILGIIRLMFINWVNRNSELGIYIGDCDRKNNGLGRESLEILLNYAFFTLNLFKVYLKVTSDNKQAIKTYKNLGFDIEGTMKKHFWIDGDFKDVDIMSIFKK